jgi:hypothetical protein
MRSKSKDISYSYIEIEQFLAREVQRCWKDWVRSVSYSEGNKKQYKLSAKKQRFEIIDNVIMSYGRLYSGIKILDSLHKGRNLGTKSKYRGKR